MSILYCKRRLRAQTNKHEILNKSKNSPKLFFIDGGHPMWINCAKRNQLLCYNLLKLALAMKPWTNIST